MYASMPRKRVFAGSLRAFHDDGTPWMTKDILLAALSHKSIKRWGICLHDKDNYTEDEYHASIERNAGDPSAPIFQVGEHKDDHWHFVAESGTSLDSAVLAKWLGIPENMIEFPTGRGAFLDCIEYLTHENPKEQAKGKHRYDDDEVITSDGFDFRTTLLKRSENKAKYGRDLDTKDQFRQDVLRYGKTLKQCFREDPVNYANDMAKLQKLRLEYLRMQKPPSTRMNFYVCGARSGEADAATTGHGGIGKGLMCRALARSLFPNIEDDEDIYFPVGAMGSAFEGYDGQPVIVWHDRRAADLLKELKGRGNVFNVFETHPDSVSARQNIKFDSIVLTNVVNIVEGIEGYLTFLDGLAGEYRDREGKSHEAEDKNQSYRRFPFIIPVHEDDFDLMLNRGVVENTSNFREYIEYKHIRGNMQKIAVACGRNEALARQLQMEMVQPVTAKYHELMEKAGEPVGDEATIRAMFMGIGTQMTDEELAEMAYAASERKAIEEAEEQLDLLQEEHEAMALAQAEYEARIRMGEPVKLVNGVLCFPKGYTAYDWVICSEEERKERIPKQRAELARWQATQAAGISANPLSVEERQELKKLERWDADGSGDNFERMFELQLRHTGRVRACSKEAQAALDQWTKERQTAVERKNVGKPVYNPADDPMRQY